MNKKRKEKRKTKKHFKQSKCSLCDEGLWKLRRFSDSGRGVRLCNGTSEPQWKPGKCSLP